MIELKHIDCMVFMKTLPDKAFELAIVDPPYGIGASSDVRGDTQYGNAAAKSKSYGKKDWDNEVPRLGYFNELNRVSKNQIIWGGNYFIENLDATPCFIVWDKENGDNGYADCELAWTSFDTAVRKVKIKWHGMLQHDMKNKESRIHPTQKPVKLYKWLLTHYAKEGDKIFDSHLGSGSIAIACHDLGFDLTGCEIDKDYFEAAVKRFNDHKKQLTMF